MKIAKVLESKLETDRNEAQILGRALIDALKIIQNVSHISVLSKRTALHIRMIDNDITELADLVEAINALNLGEA